MAKNLVIVESPTKAKMLRSFLGKDYDVESSYGHVRDLPGKKADLTPTQQKLPYASLGIDVENDFAPLYVVPPKAKKHVTKLKKLMEPDTTIWLASDEDREGEAISWHLLQILKPKKTNKIRRIVFHEITKSAILEAVDNPRELDQHLVNAQTARRVLDRLVGYTLSPLLWKKIRFGLSAGRVQSVAVKMIVDREREIKAFNPEEYWSLVADVEKEKKAFTATFTKLDGKKFVPKNELEANAIYDAVKSQDFTVKKIDEKEVKRRPSAPFTTSTLQQEAARKLGFSVKKTMTLAQKLYEGVSHGDGEAGGLITYMRTDSVNLSKKALGDAKKVISKKYGKEYAETRTFGKKQKGAQEAHEAIRPTELSRLPKEVYDWPKTRLDADARRLYELIWKRTLASQMSDARLMQTGIDLEVIGKIGEKKSHIFRATGQRVIFPGFLKVYHEDRDDGKDENEEAILPAFTIGEALRPKKVEKKQHFTKPPARYTEASLVKKMESEGIGRPSTYAPTITTVQSRGYVVKEGRNLFPTDTAFVVTDLLAQHFPDIVSLGFTAKMEDRLDDISEKKVDWVKYVGDFFFPFEKSIKDKDKSIEKQDVVSEETDEICEKCGKPMVIKLSRFGKFLSCSDYPTCKHAKPIETEEEEAERKALEAEFADEKCEKCGEPMAVKQGRFGAFLGCTAYPKCKTIKSIVKGTGVKCPKCKKGELIEKRSKRGKIFWSCDRYPDCDHASWKDPRIKEEE